MRIDITLPEKIGGHTGVGVRAPFMGNPAASLGKAVGDLAKRQLDRTGVGVTTLGYEALELQGRRSRGDTPADSITSP